MPRKYIPRAPMRIIDSVATRTTNESQKPQTAEKPTGLTEEQKRDLRSSAWGFYSSLSRNTPDTVGYL